jgi:hypothetical protein
MQLHRLIEQDCPAAVQDGLPAERWKQNDIGFGTCISYLLYRAKYLRVTRFHGHGDDEGVGPSGFGRPAQGFAPALNHRVGRGGIEGDLDQRDVLRDGRELNRPLTVDVEHHRERDLRLGKRGGQEFSVREWIAPGHRNRVEHASLNMALHFARERICRIHRRRLGFAGELHEQLSTANPNALRLDSDGHSR